MTIIALRKNIYEITSGAYPQVVEKKEKKDAHHKKMNRGEATQLIGLRRSRKMDL